MRNELHTRERPQELVTNLLQEHMNGLGLDYNEEKHKVVAVFGCDPRGAVLRLSTTNYHYDYSGTNSANGLVVPARER